MKFAIYGSRHQEEFIPDIRHFLLSLQSEGHQAVMHSKLYKYLLHAIPAALGCVTRVTDGDDFTADFAVSLGGDGTFLRTAAWVGAKEIPVIGVNTGHLGFLNALDISALDTLVSRLPRGYQTERRTLLQVSEPGLDGWPYALNEVTLTKCESASMVQVQARIDGVPLADYRADGLIIATPTGSTAYNLSVGGPIVAPTAPVFALSPIAAHSLSMRPLIIDDRSRLEFTCHGRASSFRITLDGRAYTLPIDTTVKLTKAPFRLHVVQLDEHNFADTLRRKLQWG